MNRFLRALSMLVVLGVAPIAAADQPVAAAPVLECIDTSIVENVLPEPAEECCKVCRTGKACGDTCISRDKDCTKPPGCACDG